MKKMLIALLDAMLNTTDEFLITNLQAQVYLSFSLFKIRTKRTGQICIDEGRLLLTVNQFCLSPSPEHKDAMAKLIEDIKRDCSSTLQLVKKVDS